MERVCFLARVRPERMDEYSERHKEVWPEMLAALRAAGWGNYSIFLAEDGLLVGYLETDKAINVTLYERHGFVVTADEDVLGVHCWYMRRPPRS